MSDQASPAEEPLFTPVQIEQFEADDVVAGSAIGKMLSILFLYTVIAMSLVGGWTYWSVISEAQQSAASNDSGRGGH